MEIVLVFVLAAIGGAIYQVDRTLGKINRNLERIAAALPPRN